MNASANVDLSQFSKHIRELAQITRKPVQTVVRSQAKLFAEDVMALTPPIGGHPLNEGFVAQKRIGEQAVRRDIAKVFIPADKLSILSNTKNPRLKRRLQKLIRDRNIAKLTSTLRHFKIRANVEINPSSTVHTAKRDRRGRVNMTANVKRSMSSTIILGINALKQYTASRVKNVGVLKSGWLRAARGLGAKVPAWVARHSSPGVFIDKTSDPIKPSITVQNQSSFAGRVEADVINFALNRREEKMVSQLAILTAVAWKKGGFTK